jgi:hypothetical protein
MKYKRGEINPVSALHQFAQMQRVQLDLKETVTTGKMEVVPNYPRTSIIFSNKSRVYKQFYIYLPHTMLRLNRYFVTK